MKILNYEYWIQYLIYESKLSDIYIEVPEHKAIEIFSKIEDKLKNIKTELSVKETDKIIKTELDKSVETTLKKFKTNAELKIKFTLNEFGNIMYSIEKMDYQAIISIKTHGDKIEYLILKDNERFEGEFSIEDFLDNYSPIHTTDILNQNINNVLIKNSYNQEISITVIQKLSEIKYGSNSLSIDKEVVYKKNI